MPFLIDSTAPNLAEKYVRRELEKIGLRVEFDLRHRLLGKHLDRQAKNRRQRNAYHSSTPGLIRTSTKDFWQNDIFADADTARQASSQCRLTIRKQFHL